MQDETPKKSLKDKIKPHFPTIAMCSVSGIASGFAVYYVNRHIMHITWCHITMDQIDQLKEQGQGVIMFEHGLKNKILVALPDKV